MALWGNKDSKTASGQVVIASNGTVTGTSTSFTTQAKVGNFIRVGSEDYRIKSIASNTSAVVVAAKHGATLTAVGSNTAYTLSEKPIFVSAAESTDGGFGATGDTVKVFGVDAGEQEVIRKGQHAGWVRRTVGTGNRSGRVFYETLVAGGSITGDQADDSQFADLAITIGTQPSNASKTAPATATFTVVATNNGQQDMTYQWSVSTDSGSTWTPITGATSASYTTPATVSGDNGKQFHVVITTANGLATATSDAATLTVA